MKKTLLGLGAILPVLYLVAFFLIIFPAFMAEIQADMDESSPGKFERKLWAIGVIHVSMMVVSLVVLIVFAVHLYKSPLDSGQKAIWALALFFGNIFVAPIYFYVHFVKAPRPGTRPT
jgi:heme/copper-type cytochrome/quinol oxidase subunit 3